MPINNVHIINRIADVSLGARTNKIVPMPHTNMIIEKRISLNSNGTLEKASLIV